MLEALIDTTKEREASAPLLIATIASTPLNIAGVAGYQLTFPGPEGTKTKRFRSLATKTKLQKNDRVLVAKVSGTYVILGKVELLTYSEWNAL